MQVNRIVLLSFLAVLPFGAVAATANVTLYVNVVTGNDLNGGTYGAPMKSITKAMSVANSGDTIYAAPGTYRSAEMFPIVLKSGVALIGTGGAFATILDASEANPRTRVLECHGNQSGGTITWLRGFTITGGLVQAVGADARGGGILTDNGDQTWMYYNIITGNVAIAGAPSFTAYGGGIYTSGTNRIRNNVFSNNSAVGGEGDANRRGGAAYGGGAYAFGSVDLTNNTFNGNSAIGGHCLNIGGGFTGAAVDANGSAAFYNNIVSNNTGAAGFGVSPDDVTPQGGAVTGVAGGLHHNLFFNNTGGDGSVGTDVITLDPKFAGAIDLHILFSSPARGAGTPLGEPTFDLDGRARPPLGALGAFESGGGVRRADFNADSRSDVIWRNNVTGEDAIWLMQGVTIIAPVLLAQVDANWKMAGVGDFDGDGKADVIWRHNTTGQVVIWLMDGANVSSAVFVRTVADANWKIVALGDFNFDGKSDVAWRNQSSGQVVVWQMSGTTIANSAVVSTVSDLNYTIVGVGDFDGDDKADLLWRNGLTGANVIWFMNGTSLASASITNSIADTNYKVVGVGDANADRKADVVWWNQATGDVVLWIMDGTIVSSGGFITTVNTNWHVEGVGDFDADGKIDIFWRKVSTGETVVWLMDGLTLKQSAFTAQISDLNWSVVAPR